MIARQVVLAPSLETAIAESRTWALTVAAVADRPEIKDADWPDGKAEGHLRLTEEQWRDLARSFITKACDGDRDALAEWLLDQERTCTADAEAAQAQLARPAAYAMLTSDLNRSLLRLEQHQSAELPKALDQYYGELERYRNVEADHGDEEAGEDA